MKKKIIKWTLITIGCGVAAGSGLAFYLFNMPHRDVQASAVDYTLQSKALVEEYLADAQTANNKYLREDGESKILAVSGTVFSIDTDMNDQKVVLLKDPGEKAGVSCTFMASTNANAEKLTPGDQIAIKGVIRSGAAYDEDLELYEDVIMEKCDIYLSHN